MASNGRRLSLLLLAFVALLGVAQAHHYYSGDLGPQRPLDLDGTPLDTPEVAHAKAAHAHNYAAIAKGNYHLPFFGHGQTKIGHDGFVVQTPAVAHAKAVHLAAFAHVATHRGHHGGGGGGGGEGGGHGGHGGHGGNAGHSHYAYDNDEPHSSPVAFFSSRGTPYYD